MLGFFAGAITIALAAWVAIAIKREKLKIKDVDSHEDLDRMVMSYYQKEKERRQKIKKDTLVSLAKGTSGYRSSRRPQRNPDEFQRSQVLMATHLVDSGSSPSGGSCSGSHSSGGGSSSGGSTCGGSSSGGGSE